MLGFNGGLLGKRRKQDAATPGLWFPNERALIVLGSDSYWDNVSLLLHMDGSNGSTTFTDSSSNALTVTANGNAQISTALSKFSGASATFDGSGDYLSIADTVALELGTSDFTIECWLYLAADVTTGTGVISKGTWPSGYGSFIIFYGGTQELAFYASSTGASSWDIANNQVFTAITAKETWHHVAITRSSTTFRGFFNGSKVFEFSDSKGLADNASNMTIGSGDGGSSAIKANIDELRITKGISRYNATFTPPTAPFPDS